MPQLPHRHRAARLPLIWLTTVLVCLAPVLVRSAEETPSGPAGASKVTLSCTEAKQSFMSVNLRFVALSQTTAFKKEPDLGKAGLRRGRLYLEAEGGSGLAVLWDVTNGGLYLDLNGNEDLTDDPEGVIQPRHKSLDTTFKHASYESVRFPVETAAGKYSWVADLSFSEWSQRISFNASPRSYWSGKWAVGEREYEVGLIPNSPGDLDGAAHLLLRPWEPSAQPFQVQNGSLDAIVFPSQLALNQRLFSLSRRFVRDGDTLTCELDIAEQPTKLGQLEVSGQWIDRMVLGDANRAAVLEGPKGMVEVPIGVYPEPRVQLRNGSAVAFLERPNRPGADPVAVATDTPARLAMGGPLTNTVSVSPRGQTLVLSYQLVGAGGERFNLAIRDYSKPPRFAVRQAGNEVATGQFEFG